MHIKTYINIDIVFGILELECRHNILELARRRLGLENIVHTTVELSYILRLSHHTLDSNQTHTEATAKKTKKKQKKEHIMILNVSRSLNTHIHAAKVWLLCFLFCCWCRGTNQLNHDVWLPVVEYQWEALVTTQEEHNITCNQQPVNLHHFAAIVNSERVFMIFELVGVKTCFYECAHIIKTTHTHEFQGLQRQQWILNGAFFGPKWIRLRTEIECRLQLE